MSTIIGIIVGVVLGIALAIVTLFMNNIILFNSIVASLCTAFILGTMSEIHPAFLLLIFIVEVIILRAIQHTKVGIIIVGGGMSLVWAYAFSKIAESVTDGDQIWRWVIFGLSLIFVVILHKNAYDGDGIEVFG